MTRKQQLALQVLPLGLLLSACAFPQEKELGRSLRASVKQQQVSNGAKVFENNAYEMQRGMNSHYGARPAPTPIEPSIKVGSTGDSPGN
jgi:hypothetical protein